MNSKNAKIEKMANNIIEDNNFLFAAFENRLVTRLTHIFEKNKIPMNKNIIKKNLEENLINNMMDINTLTIEKYVIMIEKYENIINNYITNKESVNNIKKATMGFIERVKDKNKTFLTIKDANNFKEYINSIILVYDSNALNVEVMTRIDNDTKEIINEFNRNNYNFVLESINVIIKNIIEKM